MVGIKHCGFLVLTVSLSFAGILQAQEPALNIQAPATAPILENAPAPVVTSAVPEVVEAPPVVKPEPAPVVTNHPVHKAAPVVVHTPTNVPVHVVTPTVEVPVVHEAVVPTASPVVVAETDKFFVDTWKDPSFEVGTRILQVKLQDKSRGKPSDGSFFGTITQINEKQDDVPDKVFIQCRLFHSPVWVGVSYDHVTASTMDDLSIVPDGSGTDGNEEIHGFIPYVQAAWDNETRFTPYAQAGYAFYQAQFVPNSWGDNGRRYVTAKTSVSGLELGGGLGIRLYKNLSADLFAQYVKVDDITGQWFYNYGNNFGGPFIMTMSYVAYGAGLSCRF